MGKNRTPSLQQLIQLRVSADLARAIDDWRRFEPDIPTRSEAIRRLVGHGLAARPPRGPS